MAEKFYREKKLINSDDLLERDSDGSPNSEDDKILGESHGSTDNNQDLEELSEDGSPNNRQDLDEFVNPAWSAEKGAQFKEYEKYLAACLEHVHDTRVNGPNKRPYPVKPTFSWKSIIGSKKAKTSTTSEGRRRDISQMSDEEFNEYLKSLLRHNEDIVESTAQLMPTTDLQSMGLYLNNSYSLIKGRETELFKEYLDYGENLTLAKKRFDQLKKENKSQEKWGDWIEKNVKISASYVRRLMQMSRLVNEYPKLKELNISFTELFKIKLKIEEVFTRNHEISTYWKE